MRAHEDDRRPFSDPARISRFSADAVLGGWGGDLKLCGLSKPVRAVFELVRMHRVFDIYAMREEVVRAFERAPAPRPHRS